MGQLLKTRRFHSSEVAEITGATLRQLQHWDESNLVSPNVEEGRGCQKARVTRIYTVLEVIRARIIVELESMGFSLQSLRPVIPFIQNEVRLLGDALLDTNRNFFMITDAISVVVDEDAKILLKIMAESPLPWVTLAISDFVRTIANGKARHSAG